MLTRWSTNAQSETTPLLATYSKTLLAGSFKVYVIGFTVVPVRLRIWKLLRVVQEVDIFLQDCTQHAPHLAEQ